jgi:periplasmic divalent cation tolerance protein
VIVTDVVIVLTTAADQQADELARTLVDERLAACVNVHAAMTSTYRWNGRAVTEPERQLVIKTRRSRLPDLERRLHELHAYELPELIVLSPESASDAYASWVGQETTP